MENHFVQIENRNRITVTDVTAVEAFDEGTIIAELSDVGLIISGQNLHIEILDLDTGKLEASGMIENINYSKKKAKKKWFDRVKK